MFTGIVEGQGALKSLDPDRGGVRIGIDLGELAEGVQIGDSIALDGCCLTVVRLQDTVSTFEAVPETLRRTTLGDRRPGARINLERSMRLGDRLGGHLVTGHVDGVGELLAREAQGNEVDLHVAVPEDLRKLLIHKGSVALDGISLTIAALTDQGFRVAVIPHTLEVTTLGARVPGDRLNLETDVLGKWVARLLGKGRPEGTIRLEDLAREGF